MVFPSLCVYPQYSTMGGAHATPHSSASSTASTTSAIAAASAGSLPTRAAAVLNRSSTSRTRSMRADRKSTRLNSSHVKISYAVFCLKKKKKKLKNKDHYIQKEKMTRTLTIESSTK